MKTRRGPIQVFRIASLVVPSAIAWHVAFSASERSALIDAVMYTLGPLWCLLAAALAIRSVDALARRRRAEASGLSLLDRIDVLTASGSALSWLGGGAIVAAVWIGWASLSVVGLLGLGVFHLVVLWTLWMAGGEDPWRRVSLSRRFVPERAVEGAAVIEELRLSGACIPIGFRLFASGRVGPRWPTSRYAIEGADAGGEIVLETEIGPALRGEHEAEPLEVWLEDVFGLCHSARIRAGAAALTVLPRPRPVLGGRDVLGAGGEQLEPRAAQQMPTEGSLRLREYQPGDDARRIHWVRSLSAGQTVVRLPDEIPRDRPAVRLVLDTYLPGAEALSCPAPAELLDALVAVWLGVGRALAEVGTRVTLVTAARDRVEAVPMRRGGGLQGPAPALELGARARWQDAVPLDRLLNHELSVVVSYRLQPDPPGAGDTRWILVREWTWTHIDPLPRGTPAVFLPHPIGSPDNRSPRRRRERLRLERARSDHARFTRLCGDTRMTRAASFVAMPAERGEIRLEALT